MIPRRPRYTLFPYTTLFRSRPVVATDVTGSRDAVVAGVTGELTPRGDADALAAALARVVDDRSEEHTAELQSRQFLGCRLLLEQKQFHKWVDREFGKYYYAT